MVLTSHFHKPDRARFSDVHKTITYHEIVDFRATDDERWDLLPREAMSRRDEVVDAVILVQTRVQLQLP